MKRHFSGHTANPGWTWEDSPPSSQFYCHYVPFLRPSCLSREWTHADGSKKVKLPAPCWFKTRLPATKDGGNETAEREQGEKLAGVVACTDGIINRIMHWWAHQIRPYCMHVFEIRMIFKAVLEAWTPYLLYKLNLHSWLGKIKTCLTCTCSWLPSLCTSWGK